MFKFWHCNTATCSVRPNIQCSKFGIDHKYSQFQVIFSHLFNFTRGFCFVLFLYVISPSHIYRCHSLRSSPSRLQRTLLHFAAVSLCPLHGSFNKAESSLSSSHATVCLLSFLRIVWDSGHEILCFYMLPTILKDKFEKIKELIFPTH